MFSYLPHICLSLLFAFDKSTAPDIILLSFKWNTYFNNQLNAQILLFYNNMYVTLQSSTCVEH